jgi:hypothetical protein
VLLATTIVLEGGAGAVKAHAVGLDDQSLAPPEEIRLVLPITSAKGNIHFWPGKTRSVAHVKEQALQIAARPLGLGVELVEDQAEPGDSTAAAMTSQ